MSKIEKQLGICPPVHMQKGTNRESFVSTGHGCSYCNGNGWFWGEDERGESLKNDCPVCEGSGELDAIIIVDWKPSNK